MDVIDKFELTFDRSNLNFADGEYITGYMAVHAKEDCRCKCLLRDSRKKFRKILIFFVGHISKKNNYYKINLY